MPDLDLLDLLSADHQLLLAGAPGVARVSQHLSVERDLLYPVIRHRVAGGEAVVAELRRQERRLEDRLAAVEADPTPLEQERLMEAIGDHAAQQEDLFARLRGLIPAEDLRAPMETVPLSIGGAPTHAHPQLAEGGPRGELAEDVASVADHLRDRVHPDDRARRG
ncbi:MAG TPA: hemerythrin domain-containing protein [Acidimicrobiales bacterium]|nr:hemerythrin domain-containing protein [Acidimicrobiales bacterium]